MIVMSNKYMYRVYLIMKQPAELQVMDIQGEFSSSRLLQERKWAKDPNIDQDSTCTCKYKLEYIYQLVLDLLMSVKITSKTKT